jgi:hypothetical protein
MMFMAGASRSGGDEDETAPRRLLGTSGEFLILDDRSLAFRRDP